MKAFKFVPAAVVFLLFLSFAPRAVAHDGEWGTEADPILFYGFGSGSELDLEHVDADPWKGWATFWVKNWCGDDWGDFHLKIKGHNIANVDFRDDSPFQPQLWVQQGSSWVRETGLTWNVDNAVVGAELDLYFYGNPIEHGERALIKVYTDNTASHCSSFQIAAYPTLVPEPSAMALLGLGFAGLLLRRRR